MSLDLPTGYLEKFSKQVQQTLPDHFVSLYRYGDNLSDILLVLKSASIEILALQKKVHQSFQKPPLSYHVLTLEGIQNGHDVFPIEFLEMKENRLLLAGRDVLADVSVDLIHVRHECEFYLRSNLMKLREGYLQPKAQLSNLIRQSLPLFLSVFKAFHVCQNQPIPKTKQEIIVSLGKTISFKPDVFESIFNAGSSQNIDLLFGDYLETLTQIETQIDAF